VEHIILVDLKFVYNLKNNSLKVYIQVKFGFTSK